MAARYAHVRGLISSYLEQLSSELPSSSGKLLGGSGSGNGASRLVRLVQLAAKGGPLRSLLKYCSDEEQRVLFANAGWVTIKRDSFTGEADPINRRPNAREVAAALHMKWDRYRRVITSANKAVQRALDEMREAA